MNDIEPGFNSDVVWGGVKYHVQTEDWGNGNPYVVTRVFNSGAVVLSLKTSYQDIETRNFATGRQAIRLGMRDQHQKVLDQLISGTLFQAGIK
jgi:hypothetical protein